MTRNLPKPWNDDLLGPEPRGYDDVNVPASRDGLLDLALRFVALARRNWLLVALFVAAAVSYTEYRRRTERPTYRARAVIQLRDRATMLASGIGNETRMVSASDAMLSQIQVLHSRAVAREIVGRLGLRLHSRAATTAPIAIDDVYVAPDAPSGALHLIFGSSTVTATGMAHGQARYGTPIELGKIRFTVQSKPAVGSAELDIVPLEDAVDEVTMSLRGKPRDRTSILDIAVTTHDPVLSQRIANTAVQVFQEITARNDKQESVRRREFIQQQVAKVEAQLSEAQLQYNRFLARGEGQSSADRLKSHQTALADIEARKQELESEQHTYLGMLDSLRNPAFEASFRERLSVLLSSQGMSGNPLVNSLYAQLARYEAARDTVVVGPIALAATNPDVRRLDTLISSTRANLLRAASLQVAAMSARVTALEDLEQKFSQGLSTLPSLEVQQSTLQAQAETYRRQAEKLRDAFQTAQIEEAAQGGQIDVVDLALMPGAPIESSKAPRFVIAVLLALALATTAAYIIENHKDVIRRREELAMVSPLPNLALVPRFRKLPGAKRWLPPFGSREVSATKTTRQTASPVVVAPAPARHVVTVADVHSPGAEAYRTLRTNLLFSAAVQSLHRVIVTSAAPKEGKSTTAANLAAACAQQGQRVLLIDCDLRGPTVHTLFNRPRAPGLTNVLIGTVGLEDALQRTNLPELRVLTAGTTPPNPAELLGSPKMAKLLDDLSTAFDLVIIDTPPLLAASDAAILGRIADGTLMVVRAGQTQRIAVQEAIQQLHTVGARVLGTVLNDPDAEIAKFAPYYYQYYQSYYHARGRT
jgi:tyrosine-protein kinase Etk/Wzc